MENAVKHMKVKTLCAEDQILLWEILSGRDTYGQDYAGGVKKDRAETKAGK